jgi:hypothetical protein
LQKTHDLRSRKEVAEKKMDAQRVEGKLEMQHLEQRHAIAKKGLEVERQERELEKETEQAALEMERAKIEKARSVEQAKSHNESAMRERLQAEDSRLRTEAHLIQSQRARELSERNSVFQHEEDVKQQGRDHNLLRKEAVANHVIAERQRKLDLMAELNAVNLDQQAAELEEQLAIIEAKKKKAAKEVELKKRKMAAEIKMEQLC